MSDRPLVSEVYLRLPVPVTKNRLLVRRRNGVHRSPAYRKWIADAGWTLQMQRPGCVAGKYALSIGVPEAARGDTGNYETALSDLLQAQGVIENDKLAQLITSYRQSEAPEIIVRVTAWRPE